MSRSRKKPIVKDKSNHKWYNRKFRRVNKQRVNLFKEPKLMDELVNRYDVCDWIFHAYNKEQDIKYRRK